MKLCIFGIAGHSNCSIRASEAIARLQLVPSPYFPASILGTLFCLVLFIFCHPFLPSEHEAYAAFLMLSICMGKDTRNVISFQARIKPRLFLYCLCITSIYTTKRLLPGAFVYDVVIGFCLRKVVWCFLGSWMDLQRSLLSSITHEVWYDPVI